MAGYEDTNDSNYLRHDPILKIVCDKIPKMGAELLASQPTISRLEKGGERHPIIVPQNLLLKFSYISFVATGLRTRKLLSDRLVKSFVSVKLRGSLRGSASRYAVFKNFPETL